MEEKLNVMIDFSAIRAGGGVQLATNFINRLKESDFSKFNCYLLLPSEGALSLMETPDWISGVCHAPTGYMSRAWFYCISLRKWIKDHQISRIFTFFGCGVPHPKEVKSIVSVAYPIICYPDSPFWPRLSIKTRALTALRNWMRVRLIRKANLVLAETDTMKGRLVKHCGIAEKRIRVLGPVPTEYVPEGERVSDLCDNYLVLSGSAVHKNLDRLIDVAKLAFEEHHVCKFLISIDRDQLDFGNLDQRVIDEHFVFLGSFPPEKVCDAYAKADALLNLSDLESFSNNYMEAWKVGIPMVCSDRDFARNICGESAIYVEPHKPISVLEGLKELSGDRDRRERMVAEGKQRIAMLPSFDGRFNAIASWLQDCE